jgi:hypothetical protein
MNLMKYYKKGEHKHKSKSIKPKQQRFNKTKLGCYKCGKPGHFAKDCRVKNTIKQLQISNEDKVALIKVLEIKDTESSEEESNISTTSSSNESYCSCDSTNSNFPNISFGCKDNC